MRVYRIAIMLHVTMTATSDLAAGYNSNVSEGFCDQVYVAATALTIFSRC